MQTWLALTFACTVAWLLGCSDQSTGKAPPKDDFAGLPFSVSRDELQAQGFICKAEQGKAKGDTMCTHFDRLGSAFGKQTKGVKVLFDPSGKAIYISVGMSPEVAGLQSALELTTAIGSVYASIPERDMHNSTIHMSSWKRPDGSSVRFTVIGGVRGVIATDVSLTAYSPEWETKAAASDAAEKASTK